MNQDEFLTKPINQFISVDWGTTNLRIRLVNLPDYQIVQELRFSKGIKVLFQEWGDSTEERESLYLRYLRSCLDQFSFKLQTKIPIVISGMASSSIGIRELPYANVPFGVRGKGLYVEQIKNPELEQIVWLISGVQTANDVIRGEEVQMIGLIGEHISSKQLFILPGTHSKHILVEGGQVVDFKTFMTGELFEVIGKHTVLNNSIQQGKMGEPERKAFISGVKRVIESSSVLNAFFQVRTNSLLHQLPVVENYYFLSGLLIGEEIRSLKTEKGLLIKLCASQPLTELYLLALETLGVLGHTEVVHSQEVETAALKGQWITLNHFINTKHENV